MTTRVDLAALRQGAMVSSDDLDTLLDIVEAVKSELGFPQRRYDSIRGEWICCHCESTWEFKSYEWHHDNCPGTRLAALLARVDTGEGGEE